MEPLDLSKKPPRSPWVKIGGAYMLARTIDKLRASLPGGNMGPYRIAPGFSERLLQIIGCSEEELRDVVARAKSDDDVVAWVGTRIDKDKLERYNERASKRAIGDVDDLEDFAKRYPVVKDMSHDTPIFDMLDKDDAVMYSRA